MMTYAMLYQILVEAEDRTTNKWPMDVRIRSKETVDLVYERLANEGITRAELKSLAKNRGSDLV